MRGWGDAGRDSGVGGRLWNSGAGNEMEAKAVLSSEKSTEAGYDSKNYAICMGLRRENSGYDTGKWLCCYL